jgi:ABC-2 type transport system permease protein
MLLMVAKDFMTHRLFYHSWRYWRIFWLFRKLHLMRTLEYRANFGFWGVVSAIWTVFNFFFFSLISGVGNGIGGWTQAEMFVLLSVFTIIDAFTWSFFYHNMSNYTNAIFSGELSNWLLRPIDTQFLLMTNSNNYTNIFRLVMGVVMLGWSLQQTQVQLTPHLVVVGSFLFLLSLLMIYSIWFTCSTGAFYVDRLNNINEVIPSLRRVWQVPRSVYTGLASTVATVIVPLGLASSIPSEVLLGKESGWWIWYFVGVSLGSFFFSRWFFHFSLRRFVGVGS